MDSELTLVEEKAVGAAGDARVGALAEMETRPAGATLVTAAAHTSLTRRRTLLTALPVVPEKPTGTLGYTHPGGRTGHKTDCTFKKKKREKE